MNDDEKLRRRLRASITFGKCWTMVNLFAGIFSLINFHGWASIALWFAAAWMTGFSTFTTAKTLKRWEKSDAEEAEFREHIEEIKRRIEFGMVEQGFWPITRWTDEEDDASSE